MTIRAISFSLAHVKFGNICNTRAQHIAALRLSNALHVAQHVAALTRSKRAARYSTNVFQMRVCVC